jgi:CheY-like chemotaxis protein
MARLLIVDDDPQIVNLLRHVAERHGFEVMVALDAREAFAVFEPFEPDVVLSDVQMPGTRGDEMLDDMRLLRPELKGVLISGQAQPPSRKYAILPKPWREDVLVRALGSAEAGVIYL